jgi:hypothetical protein
MARQLTGRHRQPRLRRVLGIFWTALGRNVIGTALKLLVGVHRTLGVIGGFLGPQHRRGLKSLIGVSQLLDTLVVLFRNRGKLLRIAGLTSAIGTYLAGIFSEFVWSGLVIGVAIGHGSLL